ncbi:MAG: twin-arginine translocase subunit TatC [Myxococcales bacterium]|nr:twin-arginine translocase subunit TatC [Myxococcales bacterium]
MIRRLADPDGPDRDVDAEGLDPEDDVEMGFFDHLAELRKRLLLSLYGVLPCFAVTWFFREEIFSFLKRPLDIAWASEAGGGSLHYPNPLDPFIAYIKISFVTALILASPWIFLQIWAFIAPGLYRRERRIAIPFVIATAVFFIGGAAFGYTFVLPFGFEYLKGFGQDFQATIMIQEYVSLSTRLLVAFGVVFEVPVVTTLLALLNIVSWKQLLAFGRWWILLSSVISAILTPPDPMSQVMMMVPLNVLYFLSVGLAYMIARARGQKDGDGQDG